MAATALGSFVRCLLSCVTFTKRFAVHTKPEEAGGDGTFYRTFSLCPVLRRRSPTLSLKCLQTRGASDSRDRARSFLALLRYFPGTEILDRFVPLAVSVCLFR